MLTSKNPILIICRCRFNRILSIMMLFIEFKKPNEKREYFLKKKKMKMVSFFRYHNMLSNTK